MAEAGTDCCSCSGLFHLQRPGFAVQELAKKTARQERQVFPVTTAAIRKKARTHANDRATGCCAVMAVGPGHWAARSGGLRADCRHCAVGKNSMPGFRKECLGDAFALAASGFDQFFS
ncbi:protein of unknown function [Desulfovibrio sp. 86]|nr:protein of unknown function [Desulfovibrio sp. 86]